MAAESRRPDPSVEESLFNESYRFEFFQAVKLLEQMFPDRTPVGRQHTAPDEEVVRFRSHLSMSFPASAIHDIAEADRDGDPVQMTVAFMGLTGPQGTLPQHYTELLLERVRQGDTVLRDFLDLFNHRLISLFYRAWEKYRLPLTYERAARREQEDDTFAQYLFHLMGMGTTGLRGRMEVKDEALLSYTGLLSQHPHSASALQALLQDYFGVSVCIRQFVGQWLPLSAGNRTRLDPQGANHRLGVNAVLGSHVWAQQAKFRLRLGPLTLAEFRHFLPAERGFSALVQLTHFFAGEECDFDVQLVLRAEEVPACRLGRAATFTLQLGRSAWLGRQPCAGDVDDAIFLSSLDNREPQKARRMHEEGNAAWK
jgi:type VI secretion system protein ImpH